MELFLEMNDENLGKVVEIMNDWWNTERVPLRARVVLIYKKGDTSKWENYRPISLLNTIYKLYAAIVHNRLATVIDPYLQKTQYGFRKSKGTADAIHCVRRIAEYGEITGNTLYLVLLDWEKHSTK